MIFYYIGKRIGRPPRTPQKEEAFYTEYDDDDKTEVDDDDLMPPPGKSPFKLGHECKYCQKRFHNPIRLHQHKVNAHR